MALTGEQITALLADAGRGKGTSAATKLALDPPHHLGPLTWVDDYVGTCASRGCGGPCRTKVRGVHYCTSHALYELSRIVATEIMLIPLDDCTCKAGVYSKGNIHTKDCTLYDYESDLMNVEGELL